jgi:hypothetical protein
MPCGKMAGKPRRACASPPALPGGVTGSVGGSLCSEETCDFVTLGPGDRIAIGVDGRSILRCGFGAPWRGVLYGEYSRGLLQFLFGPKPLGGVLWGEEWADSPW